MLNKTQPTNTIETDLIVLRDNKLDPSFKRRQAAKHIKRAVTVTGAAGLTLSVELAHSLNELFTPVKLDVFDALYGTNLRAQWFAGKRTQRILAAKRSYGL